MLKQKMPPDIQKIIQAIEATTIEVLRVQAATVALKTDPVFCNQEPSTRYQDPIAGIVRLAGRAYEGTFVIGFSEETLIQLVSRILREPFEHITPMIESGAGELANIIFAGTKKRLNKRGFGIESAIPVICKDKKNAEKTLSQGDSRWVLPFTTDAGLVRIHFSVSPKSDENASISRAG